MAWFKVDDKLFSHPKWMAVPARARGLWVTAGSWCAANQTDGRVPTTALVLLGGNKRDAAALCDAHLWKANAAGWIFHEWEIYQPDAASLRASRKSEIVGGVLGNHKRWHEARKINVPDCPYCQGMPPETDIEPSPPDRHPDRVPESGLDGDPIPPVPEPVPDVVGQVSGGKLPKQETSKHPPQPCGRNHDTATPCGACGLARKSAKDDDTAAAKARSQAKSTAAKAQAAETHRKIAACDDCDEKGYTSGRKVCHHQYSQADSEVTQ